MEKKREENSYLFYVMLGVLVLGFILSFALPVKAHSWYDPECCHHMDCSEVTSVSFVNPMEASGLPQMAVTTRIGTAIVPRNFKLRESKDGQMHACMKVNDPNPATRFLCLYLPPGL